LLVLMDAEQQLVGLRPELERALAGVEAEAAERTRQLEDEERAQRREVEGIEARRGDLMGRLPQTTRSRYERTRASRDGRAVVPIVKGACGGCFRGQSPQVLQEARRGDRVLACDGCGRLVMLPPGDA
jgi:predicted  nucleic acid-binding Zn-ribbon protein